MNNKQSMIYNVLRIVVECCITDIDEQDQLTPEAVLGPSRAENVAMGCLRGS